MGMLNRIIKDPILYLIYAYGRILPDDVEHDKKYLEILYKHRVGKKLKLNPPVTFNEKMQWLKLYNRNPDYTKMVDKYEAKKYVGEVIGEQYIIPTLGVWNHFDEIDFDSLPDQFVLKCTHDSGGLVICKDKSKLDKKAAKRKIEHCLGRNYFYNTREWPYKNVKPRIIAEKYMEDESGFELKDYKVQNFDGKPMMIQVDYGRFEEHKRNLYTTDWEYIKGAILYPTDESHIIDKPKCLETLLDLASKLSKGFPYVRSDFYIIDDKVYFGELTFQHGSGFEKMTPEDLNIQMGEWLELPGGVLLKSDNIAIYCRYEEEIHELTDYKFFCFNGEPKLMFVATDRSNPEIDTKFDFYDMSFQHLPFTNGHPNSDHNISKPTTFDEMKNLSRMLAGDAPFMRVDFYDVDGKVYFGELTLFHWSGMVPYEPDEWDKKLGDWIKL